MYTVCVVTVKSQHEEPYSVDCHHNFGDALSHRSWLESLGDSALSISSALRLQVHIIAPKFLHDEGDLNLCVPWFFFLASIPH